MEKFSISYNPIENDVMSAKLFKWSDLFSFSKIIPCASLFYSKTSDNLSLIWYIVNFQNVLYAHSLKFQMNLKACYKNQHIPTPVFPYHFLLPRDTAFKYTLLHCFCYLLLFLSFRFYLLLNCYLETRIPPSFLSYRLYFLFHYPYYRPSWTLVRSIVFPVTGIMQTLCAHMIGPVLWLFMFSYSTVCFPWC